MNKKKYIFFRRSDPCIFEAAQYGLHLFKTHKPLCAATLLQGFIFLHTQYLKIQKNFPLEKRINPLENSCLKILTLTRVHSYFLEVFK